VTGKRKVRRIHLSGRTIVTYGLHDNPWGDLYHSFMSLNWPTLFFTLAGFFIAFNLAFGSLYYLFPGSVANVEAGSYWGCFFFSVETVATVGYGDMHPQTTAGHILASTEIFIGLMTIAIMTGAMFARFSRPRARFLFARTGIVRPLDGKPTLMFRAANARQNVVMEASAQLRILRNAVTPEGYRSRKIQDLALVRNQHPVFLLGWNLMHVIDESSALYGATAESLNAERAVFVLSMSGHDEDSGQTLMARTEYPASAVHWNHAYRDMLHTGPDGHEHLDYERFHDVEPLPPA